MPVFRSRVAPVLDWCSKIFVFPEGTADHELRQEVVVTGTNAFNALQLLQQKGVRTLICGALSPELLRYGEHLGFSIIYGVAGEVEEILEAYYADQLDQPRFWLPGFRCRRRRHALGGWENSNTPLEERSQNMPGGRGQGGGQRAGGGAGRGPGGGRGRMGGMGVGPGGFCVCPNCGTKEPHQPGIPCPQVRCPQCGQTMLRETGNQ